MNYKINIVGSVADTETGFRAGIDISIENGGSIAQISQAVQTAIDTCAANATKKTEE